MEILSIVTGPLAANSYVLTSGGKECVVVDCGDGQKVLKALKQRGLLCKDLLLTHGHFDHCNGAAALQKEGARVRLHEADLRLIESDENLACSMGCQFNDFRPDALLKDGDDFSCCGLNVKVLHTPGHTGGGVCYIVNDEVIFTGDTLFYRSVGRTDFPTGDGAQLLRSIREKLFTLKKDYILYPGHDRPTTLYFERENNFYV